MRPETRKNVPLRILTREYSNQDAHLRCLITIIIFLGTRGILMMFLILKEQEDRSHMQALSKARFREGTA